MTENRTSETSSPFAWIAEVNDDALKAFDAGGDLSPMRLWRLVASGRAQLVLTSTGRDALERMKAE